MTPALRVGDLVKHRGVDEHLGIILEIEEPPRDVGDYVLQARVLWDDPSRQRWNSVSSLVPVQPDGDRGITG